MNRGCLDHVVQVVWQDDGPDLIRKLAVIAGFPSAEANQERLKRFAAYLTEVLAFECASTDDAAAIRARVGVPAKPEAPKTGA